MTRPVLVGFIAGIFAGYPLAFVVGKALNPMQLAILFAASVVVLIRYFVLRETRNV